MYIDEERFDEFEEYDYCSRYRRNPPLVRLADIFPDSSLADLMRGPPLLEGLLFHVTNELNYLDIDIGGILGGQEPAWTGAKGQTIHDVGKIYAMDDFTDAVKWVYKSFWTYKDGPRNPATDKLMKMYIVVFETDGIPWEKDTHIEARDSWLKRSESVNVDNITQIIEIESPFETL